MGDLQIGRCPFYEAVSLTIPSEMTPLVSKPRSGCPLLVQMAGGDA